MPLQKNFLKSSIDALPIPKWQWNLFIVVHISLAFTFYLFSIFLKEMYKISYFDVFNSLTIEAQLDIMPSTFGFKFCFAFFSVLFAQTFLLDNLFKRPSFNQWLSTSRVRKTKTFLTNNNRVFQYSSFYFVYALFFMLYAYGYTYWAIIYVYNEFIFNLTFILLLVTMYFHQWLSIMQYFKNVKKWQWIVLGLNIGLALLFTITPMQEVDRYKAQQLERSFTQNYQIDFIETENFETPERISLVEEGILAYPKHVTSNAPHIHFNNHDYYKANMPSLTLNDFTRFVKFSKGSRSEADIAILEFSFAIGQNVEMKYVYQLQEKLREQGSLFINYFVQSAPDYVFKERFHQMDEKLLPNCQMIYDEYTFSQINASNYQGDSIHKNLGCQMIKEFAIATLKSEKNLYVLKITDNKIFLNEREILVEHLKSDLLKLISSNKNIFLEIRIDENTHFKYYLKTIDILKSIRHQLRDQYAQSLFQKNFNQLYNFPEKKEASDKSYFHFYPIKLTPKEWEYYDYLKSHK